MKKLVLAVATVVFILAGCSVSGPAQPLVAGNDIPVIHNFSADPASVQAGSGTQISWRISNAASVTIDNGIGAVAFSGTVTVYPRGNTVYRLTATNAAGSNSAMITIALAGQGPAVVPVSTGTNIPIAPAPSTSSYYRPLVTNFYATPSSIQRGRTVTLRWIVNGADSVMIDRGVGSVSLNSAVNLHPVTTTVYTLTASNRSGTATATAGVNVSSGPPAVPVIKWFTSNPATILRGGAATLSWGVANARRVNISGVGAVALAGTVKVRPGGTAVYTLTASNSAGSSQAATAVSVMSMDPAAYYETYHVNVDDVPELVLEETNTVGGGGWSGAGGGGEDAGGGGASGASYEEDAGWSGEGGDGYDD